MQQQENRQQIVASIVRNMEELTMASIQGLRMRPPEIKRKAAKAAAICQEIWGSAQVTAWDGVDVANRAKLHARMLEVANFGGDRAVRWVFDRAGVTDLSTAAPTDYPTLHRAIDDLLPQ